MDLCATVICDIAELKLVTFLMTFNGSLFDNKWGKTDTKVIGYDWPFLQRRSQMSLHETTKIISLFDKTPVVDDEPVVFSSKIKSQMISGIKEIP